VRPRVWRRRLIIGVGGLLLVLLAAGTFAAMEPGRTRTAGTPGPVCAPRPCTELGGYELYVRNVNLTASHLTMDVSFKNNTPGGGLEAVSFRHTSPMDFVLHYRSGDDRKPVFDAGCPGWEESRIERGRGAGPDRLCFNVLASGLNGAELQWTPDIGVFSVTGSVPLG
jgi:hypothetical protein